MTLVGIRRAASLVPLVAFALAALAVVPASAQGPQSPQPASSDPASSLADALSAACRQDAQGFAEHLTASNSSAFMSLPADQRLALLRRFMLLDDPGKPLLSNDVQGHAVLRCDAGGVLSEVRFGATDVHDNLAFVPVELPEAAEEARNNRFGLVREGGQWKLLSLGLLLLDIPQLARQWEQADLASRTAQAEFQAVQSLRKIATALDAYRQAYGHLPDDLSELGPPAQDGNSPEKAGLLDAALAGGKDQGYVFRYNIHASGGEAPDSERNLAAGFQLAATPMAYGKDGRKSFYLDSTGTLRGTDKHGAVATSDDTHIADPEQP